MSISDKLKNALNKLPPYLGNIHFGTILKDMSDTVDSVSDTVDSMSEYSEQPKKIGAWIDGSPIYRKAFDVLLKDLEAVDYADIINNSAFTIGMISVSGSANLISAFCAYADANGALYPCDMNTFNDTAVNFGFAFGFTIPEDQSDCTTERYYGYIDFIKTR